MKIVVVVSPSGSKTACISSELGSISRNSGSAVSTSATVTFSSAVLVFLSDFSLSELGVFLHFFGGGASSYSELESLPVSLKEELEVELELAEDEEDEVFRFLLVRRCVA